jgi:hypothetical protein
MSAAINFLLKNFPLQKELKLFILVAQSEIEFPSSSSNSLLIMIILIVIGIFTFFYHRRHHLISLNIVICKHRHLQVSSDIIKQSKTASSNIIIVTIAFNIMFVYSVQCTQCTVFTMYTLLAYIPCDETGFFEENVIERIERLVK